MLKEMIREGMKLNTFREYPKASDREVWEALPAWQRESLVRGGEQYLNYVYPSLPATLWLELTRTGDRNGYQDAQFSRRAAVSDLALAECAEHRGRFLDDLINGIFLTCEETGWHIPAHNTYIRDTEQLPLPIAARPILDLFSTQTGMMLAFVRYLLKEELDAVCPEICSRIELELKRRILDPYFSTFFWFMGNGVEPTNNWTVWCTRNILFTCFLLDTDDPVRLGVLRKAARSVDCFIDEYDDDGCCTEGASYYHHSPVCMFECIDVMNRVSDGAFSAAFSEEKLRRMANYIMKVHVGGKNYLNYADCGPECAYAGVREYLFAKATSQPDMMLFASRQMKESIAESGRRLMEGSALCERLQELFAFEEAASFAGADTEPETAENTENSGTKRFERSAFYPAVGVSLVSDGKLYFSIKAGDNTGSHKHNDTGSVIVYAGGKPLLIDVGVGSYTQKTFSDRRYEIWTMQSRYHNLPTIAGHMQMGRLQHVPGLYAAENASAEIVCLPDGTECFRASMELIRTYEENTPAESYVRSCEFSAGGDVRMTDAVRFSGECTDWTLNFMTAYPVAYDEAARTLRIGEIGRLVFDAPVSAVTEEIPVTEGRIAQSWNGRVFRTVITPEHTTVSYRIVAD